MNFMRTIAARLAAGVSAGLAGWAATVGMELTPDVVAHLEDAVFAVIMAVSFMAYGVTHKMIDSKLHPSDDARGADK